MPDSPVANLEPNLETWINPDTGEVVATLSRAGMLTAAGTRLASPLPVPQGGTGAVTAAGARTALGISVSNLGLAPSGDTTGATDTAAIQALLQPGAAPAVLQGGTFWLNASPSAPSYASIIGAGLWKTLLVQTSTTANGITIPGTSSAEITGVRIQDLSVLGPGTGSGKGISAAWAPSCIYENFRAANFGGDGVYQTNCWNQYFKYCIFDNNGGDGYHGVTAINACTWVNTQFGSNTLSGFHLNGGAGWSLAGCDIEANQQHGAYLEVAYAGTITGTDFEVNNQVADGYSNVYIGSSQSLAGPQILSCNFSGGALTVNGIQVHAALNTVIQGCEFFNHAGSDILIDAGSTGTTLGPNTFQAGSTTPVRVTDNGRYTVRPSMLTLTGQSYAMSRGYAMP